MVSSRGNRPLQGMNEAVGEDGDEPFPGESMILHPTTPAALQPRPMAMVRHCFPQALHLWKAVHIKGHPGQVPQVLQQREQRKKDGHGRQHDGHDPGHHSVYAENSHVDEPLGEAYGKGGLSQPRLQGENRSHSMEDG